MNLKEIFNQLSDAANASQHMHSKVHLNKTSNRKIPQGLTGGTAAGNIMALLISNKFAREFNGHATSYGSIALIGGLAYKALKNWQYTDHNATFESNTVNSTSIYRKPLYQEPTEDFEIKLIKSMIAASRSDGHMGQREQQKVSDGIQQMDVANDVKAILLYVLSQPISVNDIAQDVTNMTQKSELYLISCLITHPEHHATDIYLETLANALELPESLTQHIQQQAAETVNYQAA